MLLRHSKTLYYLFESFHENSFANTYLTESLKYYVADISVPSQVEDLLNKIKTDFGQIPTGLVNCAGIIKDNWLMDMTEQQWDDVLKVNLKVLKIFNATHLIKNNFFSKFFTFQREPT